MRIIFLTMLNISSLSEGGIYQDLLSEFYKRGDDIYVVSPTERRFHKKTTLTETERLHLLKVWIWNNQKTSFFEKGFSTLLMEGQYLRAIRKYFSGIQFDLILYSTPPITFCKVVQYLKQRDGAFAYLMLKDIFPQNAVDLGILCKTGWKGILYRFFRSKEKRLYSLSDYIGCMSPANCKYVLEHNPEIPENKVGECPNCCSPSVDFLPEEKRQLIRKKYQLPLDKKVFIYGGNLGRPQAIPYIIKCLSTEIHNKEAFFLVVGDGTEFSKVQTFIKDQKPDNILLLRHLAKVDFDELVASCDVGLIFLDYRFTIPNFPSRLLSYLQAGLPVVACTDPSSDMGTILERNSIGWYCPSNSVEAFSATIQKALRETIPAERPRNFLFTNYSPLKEMENILKIFFSK